jgi:hypothetical protein
VRRAAAAAAALALATAGAGCGQEESRAIAWADEPVVAPHPELPDDRIATGKLRNDGDDELRLTAADARVVDGEGRPLRASVTFAAGATHALYPPREAPKDNPRTQQERLGYVATIPPGKSVPLTIAWHARDGMADRIDFGVLSLDLPPH